MMIFVSNNRCNALDDLIRKYNLDIDKAIASDLKSFVSANDGKISYASHIIIDLSALYDTDSEITQVIDKLSYVHADVSIIILADAEGSRENMDILIKRLVKRGIFNIITFSMTEEKELFEKDFLYCMNTGKSKLDVSFEKEDTKIPVTEAVKEQQPQAAQIKPEILPDKITPNKGYREFKSHLIVSVAGTEPHIGVTHNAMLITRFLKDIGFKVCYIETGQSEKLFTLLNYYPDINFSKKNNKIQLKRVDYFSNVSISDLTENEYDIYVLDIGTINEFNLPTYLYKDIQILISGSRPWEVKNLENAINIIGVKNVTNILFNYSVPDDRNKILSMIGQFSKTAFFTEYVPSFFQSNVNIDIYKEIFKKYLLVNEENTNKNVVVKRKHGFMNILKK